MPGDALRRSFLKRCAEIQARFVSSRLKSILVIFVSYLSCGKESVLELRGWKTEAGFSGNPIRNLACMELALRKEPLKDTQRESMQVLPSLAMLSELVHRSAKTISL